jgi:hypothetical protein
VYLDAPTINTTITQLATSAYNATCDSSPDVNGKFKDAFKNLTHIESSIAIGVGLDLEVALDYITVDPVYMELPLIGLAKPFPTACLAYGTKPGETGLVAATAAIAEVTGGPGLGKPTSGSSSLIHARRPFGWNSTWEICLGMLMTVGAAFMSL